jgi:hypothetical protein
MPFPVRHPASNGFVVGAPSVTKFCDLRRGDDQPVDPWACYCHGAQGGGQQPDQQFDPYGKIPEFKFCAARVSPAQRQVAAE